MSTVTADLSPMAPEATPEIPEASPPKEETPEETLERLEQKAMDLGMRPEKLALIQAEGNCPEQIELRIRMLREWLEGC